MRVCTSKKPPARRMVSARSTCARKCCVYNPYIRIRSVPFVCLVYCGLRVWTTTCRTVTWLFLADNQNGIVLRSVGGWRRMRSVSQHSAVLVQFSFAQLPECIVHCCVRPGPTQSTRQIQSCYIVVNLFIMVINMRSASVQSERFNKDVPLQSLVDVVTRMPTRVCSSHFCVLCRRFSKANISHLRPSSLGI